MQEGEKWYPDFYGTEDGLVFRSVGGGNHDDDDDLDNDDDSNSDDNLDDDLDDDGNPINGDDSDDDSDDDGDDGNDGDDDDEEFDVDKIQNLLDPNEYPKELQGAFKKMQSVFTKKMQAGSEEIALAKLMKDNPEELMSMLAKKTGMTISKEEVKKDEDASETEKWIIDLIKKHASGDNDTKLAVARMQSSQKIDALNEKHPDWTMYEDEMAAIVKKHPTLSNDLETVYGMVTKSEDKANGIIKAGGKKKKVSTKTVTKRKSKSSPAPKTPREALNAAMEKLGYT